MRPLITGTRCFAFAFTLLATLTSSSAARTTADSTELVNNGKLDKNAAGWQIHHDEFGGFKQDEEGGNGYVSLNHNGTTEDPTMTQTVSGLVPGRVYILTASYRPGDHVAEHGTVDAPFFLASIDGETKEYSLLKKERVWNQLYFKFTAKRETVVLTFEGEIDGKDNDVDIDNVSIKLVEAETILIKAYTIKGAPGNNEMYHVLAGQAGARSTVVDADTVKAKPSNFVTIKVGDHDIAFQVVDETREGGHFLAVNDKHQTYVATANDNNVPDEAVFSVQPALYRAAGEGWVSLEARTHPGCYLRHFQFKCDANTFQEAKNTLVNFQRDATWSMVNAKATEITDQSYFLQFGSNGKYVSFKDTDKRSESQTNLYLAAEGTTGFTKLEVKADKHEIYYGFYAENLPGHTRWLELGDNHRLLVNSRGAGFKGVPGRAQFLTVMSPVGRLLEAMWVADDGAIKAKMYHPDHHYYLTESEDGTWVSSKDFQVDQPKDKSAAWKLVPSGK